MRRAIYPLKLPNQWIAAAVAEKVGVVETAAEFLQEAHG
jgi:hypothetical protein